MKNLRNTRTVRFLPAGGELERDHFTEGAACALAESYDVRAIYHQMLEMSIETIEADGTVACEELDVLVTEENWAPQEQTTAARVAEQRRPVGASGKKR